MPPLVVRDKMFHGLFVGPGKQPMSLGVVSVLHLVARIHVDFRAIRFRRNRVNN